VAGVVGKHGKGAIGTAQNLDDSAHLGDSGVVADESGDRSGPLYGESGKRESK
jgi:hypothetical protein